MNVFFKKIVPAFFAIAALTSCSSDDLLGNFDGLTINNDGDLAVTVEQLEDETAGVTRAGFIKTGNKLYWQKDVDSISVYNSSLFVYDWYAFDGKSFKIDELGPFVDEAAYALFPKSSVITTHWDRRTEEVSAAIYIPTQLTYSEDNLTVKDSVIYVSNIPMWGTAENDGEVGKVKTTLYYTTGILKVTLKNAFSNKGTVDALLIRGWEDLNDVDATDPDEAEGAVGTATAGDMQIAGSFLATLDKVTPQNTQLVPAEAPVTSKSLYVDLSNMEDTTSVIYVPVPAGTYGHLVISAGKATKDANGVITAFASTEVLKHYSNKTIARAKIYAGTNKEYAKGTAIQNTGNTPELINGLLKNFAANKGDVKITDDGLAGLTVTKTDDEVIEIPNMACDTLFLAPTDIVGAGGATTLTIKDAKNAAYAGAVVVEVPKTQLDINITLKNAKVYLRGLFNEGGTKNFTNAKKVAVNGVSGGKSTLTVGNGAVDTYVETVDPDAYVGDITIAAGAHVSTVEVASIYAVTKNIKIQGVVGEVTALAADTEVSGEGTVETLTTSGNVIINASKELNVITTKLQMEDSKKLTLSAGYVNNLTVAEKKTVTIENNEVFPTAIKAVVLNGAGDDKAKLAAYTSKWCGKAMTCADAADPGYGYDDVENIYTASQLTVLAPAGTIKLFANIDLNNKAWAPIAFTGSFDGQSKTIKNFTIAAQPAKDAGSDATNAGFFSTITPAAAKAIQNLTFDNVTISTGANNKGKITNNIGILAGNIHATAALTITNVKVASAKIGNGATTKNQNIGGLVGLISGTKTVTIEGTSKTKKGSVDVEITGYANMGGLVGAVTTDAADALIVTNYTATPTFIETVTGNEADKDLNLGTIGTYIGSLNGASATVSIGSDADGEGMLPATNFVAGKRKAFGFFYNFAVDSEILYRFYGSTVAKGAVGYSPSFTSLSIDGKLYISTPRYSNDITKEKMSADTDKNATQDGSTVGKGYYLNFFVKHGNTAWSSEQ